VQPTMNYAFTGPLNTIKIMYMVYLFNYGAVQLMLSSVESICMWGCSTCATIHRIFLYPV